MTQDQERQITQTINLMRYLLENKIKGNLNLNFPGNGSMGGTAKFEAFFALGECQVRDIDILRFAGKNATNRTAAEAIDGLFADQ